MSFLSMLQEAVHTEEKKVKEKSPKSCAKCGGAMSYNEVKSINGHIRTGYTCYGCGTSLWNKK